MSVVASTVVVISIDAIAPRYVTPATMPNLVALGRAGAACYQARTVNPPITMPAHVSLLRGVDPSVHGVVDNRFDDNVLPLSPDAAAVPTFLEHVRRTGSVETASVVSWAPMDAAVDRGAVSTRMLFDDGYNPDIDGVIVDRLIDLVAEARHAVVYGYLIAPDLAGHDHGWGSDRYLDALRRVDRALGRLVAALRPDDSLVVTTDHGGLGTDHGVDGAQAPIEDMETFVAIRSPRVAQGAVWSSASILDVAPTVARLCGLDPHPGWQGTSLLGRERPLLDVLIELVDKMADHTYGERVTMRDHALQTADNARAAGASSAMIAAALLHDIGHLEGEAGAWGLPDHAEVAGRTWQALLAPEVIEPIRLHVAAKRWLVANDPDYRNRLSEASLVTLDQQGDPFTEAESAAFLVLPFAAEAIELRRWDDGGKRVGFDGSPASTATLEDVRQHLEAVLGPVGGKAASVSPVWARDACRCPSCRDEGNDQHLVDPAELHGWSTIALDRSVDPTVVEIRRDDEAHRCLIPAAAWADETDADGSTEHRTVRWDGARMAAAADARVNHGSPDWIDRTAVAVDRYGLAVLSGVPTAPGTVLTVASALGFVRVTNYGELFDVRNEPQPENLAYTSVGLPLHTDNPYREPCPTVQLLHCLQPADEGGGSVLVDGFEAAERLRVEDPRAFTTLTTTPVRFRFHGGAVDLQAQRTVIELGADGRVTAVNVNHRSMEAPAPGPGVGEFYRAYLRFHHLLAEPALAFELTLAAGELIVFDNRRVLHARTAFDTSSARHLQGCYIDIDALRSRARRSRSAVTRSATGSR